MPLQAGMDKIGGFAVDSPVEIASPDQHEVNQVSAEFEQQPLGRNMPAGTHRAVREPHAVAVEEAELHRCRVLGPQVIAKRFAGSHSAVGNRLLALQNPTELAEGGFRCNRS